MVGRDDRRRPRGDEGATSTSGWEATKPLNASDRVEDAHLEDALDAPLRRGVELARLALVRTRTAEEHTVLYKGSGISCVLWVVVVGCGWYVLPTAPEIVPYPLFLLSR